MAFYGVTTAVSETLTASGTVSVDVADPSVLTVGRKLTIRPQGVGEFQGVTVSRRSHRALVNSISGGTVSLTLGQDGTAGRIIKKGDILDQTGEQIYAEVDDHETRITALEGGTPVTDLDALQQLLASIYAICGDKVRACWMPDAATVGTTIDDRIVSGRVWTYDSIPAGGRYTAQGSGVVLSFNGSSQWVRTPDAGDLSPGNGSVDQPLSIFVVGNVTNTAAVRAFITKFTAAGSQREWAFSVNASDLYQAALLDESAGPAVVLVPSTTAAVQGSMETHGVVYSALDGGSHAGYNVQFYTGGTGAATTPAAAAGYVAMEDKSAAVYIGASDAGAANFFQGSLGLVLVVFKALTATDMQALDIAASTFFGL